MTLAELDTDLRAIAGQLHAINEQMPEMTGMDLAYDRGNVSREEWEAANEASKLGMEKQDALVAGIDRLRETHAEVMAAYVAQLLARLAELQRALDAKLAGVPENQQDFNLKFSRSLLPSIVRAFTDWRDRTPSTTSMPWAWRVVFRVADETAAALARA